MPDLTIKVRPETEVDLAAIRAVNEAAFPGKLEADLVDLCRARGRVILSLVALVDAKVVGHVLFTPVTLEPAHPGWMGLGLGPIAVRPEYQRQGVGSRLMTIGLEICRSNGVDFVVLLGDPGYYLRFGFIPAREFGLSSEYGDMDEFQARELNPGVLRGVKALVKYTPEFGETVG